MISSNCDHSGTSEAVGENVEAGQERIQTPTQVTNPAGVSQLESVQTGGTQSSSPSNSSNQSAGTGSAQSAGTGSVSAGAVGTGSGSPGPAGSGSTQLTAQLQFSAPITAPNSAYPNPLSYAGYNPQTIRNAPY